MFLHFPCAGLIIPNFKFLHNMEKKHMFSTVEIFFTLEMKEKTIDDNNNKYT